MAAHNNDPATHLREILEYNDAIAAVKQFVDQNEDTMMISVSDHETGGLSAGLTTPPKYPECILNFIE
jgi:alkaline phosphatase